MENSNLPNPTFSEANTSIFSQLIADSRTITTFNVDITTKLKQ
jgi:hypothetical protein